MALLLALGMVLVLLFEKVLAKFVAMKMVLLLVMDLVQLVEEAAVAHVLLMALTLMLDKALAQLL